MQKLNTLNFFLKRKRLFKALNIIFFCVEDLSILLYLLIDLIPIPTQFSYIGGIKSFKSIEINTLKHLAIYAINCRVFAELRIHLTIITQLVLN
ncbi:hypothetical protein BpHYR1_009827 [Brachionus plicatilis]|uniref:Uncharacterized protein n=1 Tax=Brachionus plicatilis TaxID=10195 RepID=A0A3M7SX47_BRAPC|nr:hypothetical protein BpHYR1_009827 [Brachionus plicatilis]